ncbi:MAG: cupin domain-containing protein [Solirubrobacteraceae bacterium]
MATAGQTIDNPITGERVRFVETASDTRGERLVIEVSMRPAGRIAAAHVHSRQEERFTVLAGAIRMVLAGRTRSAAEGETVVVAPGVAHTWWNDGVGVAQVRVEFRPALDTETFFETFFGLARDEKTNRKGMPNLLRSLVLVADLGDSCPCLPRPPPPVQRLVARALAPIGRLAGYRAVYARYSPRHPTLREYDRTMASKVGDRVVLLRDREPHPRVETVIEAHDDEIKVWEQGVPGSREPREMGWLPMTDFRPATDAEIDAADGPRPGESHD